MICEGYSPEAYGLFTLFLLEDPAAADIRRHLQNRCETCCREVQRSAELWYCLGLVESLDKTARPSPDLKRRILAEITPRQRAPWWGGRTVAMWAQAMAASLILATAVWFGVHERGGRPGGRIEIQPGPIAQSQPADSEWRERAERAERELQALRGATRAVEPKSASPVVARGDDTALTNALSANQSLTDSLNRERERAGSLENELNAQRQLLSSARRELADSQAKAETLGSDVSQLRSREDRVSVLTTRVQQLERENSTYRDAVSRLEGQLDRNTRLVAFLNSPSLKMVRLQGTEAADRALGTAFIVEGQKVLFYAANLPPLPAGRAYQLWIMRGRGPAIVSGGIAKPDTAQRLSMEFANGAMIADVRGVAVTDEPEGGSPGPTGHKILVGTVRS